MNRLISSIPHMEANGFNISNRSGICHFSNCGLYCINLLRIVSMDKKDFLSSNG
jgi:hypothetical protein